MDGLFLGIETGGTKVVGGVARLDGDEPAPIAEEVVVPTGPDPEEVVGALHAAVSAVAPASTLTAAGVGAFGPIDLRSGTMLQTPKPGWSGFPLAEAVRRRWGIPVRIDTDVNAAAIAEWRWGAARGADVAVYLTVGTGIGGGVVVGGAPVHGLLHPEVGHLSIPRHPDDGFEGSCGAHGACFEGLAAGPALRGRWGMPGEDLPDDHPAWDLEVWYLGRGLAQIALAYSPEVVVLGGGVGGRHLHGAARAEMVAVLDGYVPAPRVVPPRFGHRAGLVGAFALAGGAMA